MGDGFSFSCPSQARIHATLSKLTTTSKIQLAWSSHLGNTWRLVCFGSTWIDIECNQNTGRSLRWDQDGWEQLLLPTGIAAPNIRSHSTRIHTMKSYLLREGDAGLTRCDLTQRKVAAESELRRLRVPVPGVPHSLCLLTISGLEGVARNNPYCPGTSLMHEATWLPMTSSGTQCTALSPRTGPASRVRRASRLNQLFVRPASSFSTQRETPNSDPSLLGWWWTTSKAIMALYPHTVMLFSFGRSILNKPTKNGRHQPFMINWCFLMMSLLLSVLTHQPLLYKDSC